MCLYLSPLFQNLSVNASIFTLTAIAVDRYKLDTRAANDPSTFAKLEVSKLSRIRDFHIEESIDTIF